MTRKLVNGSVSATKTAAEHFAVGFRNRKGRWGGKPRPRGSVKVGKVGRCWGVWDYDPQPRGSYISLAVGKSFCKLWHGK